MPDDFAWSDEDTDPRGLDAPTSFPDLEPRRIYTEADLEAARVEERERVAQAIEAMTVPPYFASAKQAAAHIYGLKHAARIARGEAT